MKKIIKYLVVGVPIAFSAYVYIQVYSGYCLNEYRYLSMDEKIRAAVPYFMAGGSSFEAGELIPYESVDEFLKINPDCCYMHQSSNRWGREGYPKPDNFGDGPPFDWGFLARLISGISEIMAFDYQERYIDHSGILRSRLVRKSYWVLSCGGVADD